MKKGRIIIDFDNITKEMKEAFLIAAKIREETGVEYVCSAVNSKNNNHSSFGGYETIGLECPNNGGCSICPGCGDLLHETIKKWTKELYSSYRTPQKKDKGFIDKLKRMRRQ